jgi:hypothetical protein
VSKTLRQLRIRYDLFGVLRQLSEHRLAYILWRYLGRWFRACGKLRAAAKKHLREKTATGLKAVAASRLATVLTTRRSPAEWPVSFKGNKEKPAGREPAGLYQSGFSPRLERGGLRPQAPPAGVEEIYIISNTARRRARRARLPSACLTALRDRSRLTVFLLEANKMIDN